MNLYLLSFDNDRDHYDAVVVCAPSEAEARKIDPSAGQDRIHHAADGTPYDCSLWPADPSELTVRYLGVADPGLGDGQIICASYVSYA